MPDPVTDDSIDTKGPKALERSLDPLGRSPLMRKAKRVVVFVVGFTVLFIGVALIVLPGPAVLVIPAGLGILALEFAWARRWLKKARSMIGMSDESSRDKADRKNVNVKPVETANPPSLHKPSSR